MRITVSIKTLLRDIDRGPVGCSLKGEGGVVRSGIVCVLGWVIAHIADAVVLIDTINPFPHVTPQALNSMPNHIDIAIRSGRSTR